MRIGVLGSGGREHAIAWKLRQSPEAEIVFVMPGNGGTGENLSVDQGDFSDIRRVCEKNGLELLVVGPEQPLVNGIVEYFHDSPVDVFGPDASAARLEGSKAWAKQFMTRHGVSTPEYWITRDDGILGRIIRSHNGEIVVKYDGLAGGKGVFVCSSETEAWDAVTSIRTRYGSDTSIILEEKLTGQELSIIGITDGRTVRLLSPSQDHKQARDGDKGPNTGGMGAYCPVPICTEEVMATIRTNIVDPTMSGIRADGLQYRGVIYFGLMITDTGPKVLEYNVRFGDPETEVILPSLKSDLLPLIQGCFDDSLARRDAELHNDFIIDVVLASEGYPGPYDTGFPITGLDPVSEDILIFHSGTKRRGDEILTAGGRVLNMVARAPDLSQARDSVYEACSRIRFSGKYYRRDIGARVLGAS